MIKVIKKELVLLAVLLSGNFVSAQTYVTQPITGTPVAGDYYNNSQLTLNPNFSFTGGSNSSARFYIDNNFCLALGTQPTGSKNFIMVSVPRKGGLKTPADLANNASCDLSQTIQYFDGLGRPVQVIAVKASPNASNDVVTGFAYDNVGREATNYLPYSDASGLPGSYRPNALADASGNYAAGSQYAFYQVAGANYKTTQIPYAQTRYEASPMNRVLEQGAPGLDWQLGNHTVKREYSTNDQGVFNEGLLVNNPGSHMVALYRASINPDGTRTLNRTGNTETYASSQLSLTITKDENWVAADGCIGTIEEYKDNEGRIVLKRLYNKGKNNSGVDVVEMLSTYYVYDDLNNLCFVLTPKAEPDVSGTAVSQLVMDNLCYQYNYDSRGRLVRKRSPGKGWELVVYNNLDQIVATQDAVQRGKSPQEWTINRYDGLGRIIMTGIYTFGVTANQEYLNVVQGQANGFSAIWEVATGTSANNGYTATSFPSAISTTLTVNYYDTYKFAGTNIYPYSGSNRTKGLLTGSKVNILGSANMLLNERYYDDFGRPVKYYSQHFLGATVNLNNFDESTLQYDFTDHVISSVRKHYSNGILGTGGSQINSLIVSNRYEYDHIGRKINTFQKTGDVNAPEILLSRFDYNDVGQVLNKHLYSESATNPSFLQDVGYHYNERSWLTSINDPLAGATPGKLFSIQLKYNDGSTPQYNGNVTNQVWNTSGQPVQTFTYNYDRLNRITSGSSAGSPVNMSETGIAYDKMGNILKLTRDGIPLVFSHLYGGFDGNQLNSITGLPGGTYHYDKNGNMDIDGRNGTNITYNLFNLPATVTKSPGINITYTYDANGHKLKKVSGAATVDYISGIQYDQINGAYSIDFVRTDEGRAVRRTDGTYRYEFDLADQLGNVRLTFQKNTTSGQAERIQSDDFYAFGLRKSGSPVSQLNQYLYNDKELQPELTQYDFGARFYDPVIARFTSLDPLTEYTRRHSPYSYGMDNPIRFTDPTGMAASDTTYIDPSTYNLKEVKIVSTKINNTSNKILNFLWGATDYIPYAGSIKQIGMGIYHGDWKEAGLGVVFLAVDVVSAGEGGEALRAAEVLAEDALKAGAESEVKEIAEKSIVEEAEKIEMHHSDPVFMEGDVKQDLTPLKQSEHKQLHRDMNEHLKDYKDNAGNHMAPQKGNPGSAIRQNFTRQERLKALGDFYKGPGAKYQTAARDFFKQHPTLR
jgi:RHS repeat-associated protein